MTKAESIRTPGGVEVPATGVYAIDPAHSGVSFIARHMMVSKVRGHFGAFEGTIVMGETPEQSSVEVVIEAASIDTASEMRDKHVRSADFLDVEHYPEIRFTSTKVEQTGPAALLVRGDLTIRDVTRPVDLDVAYEGTVPDMRGNAARVAFSATAEIDREEFGITWNAALEGGGLVVGKRVRIELDVAAVQAVEQAA